MMCKNNLKIPDPQVIKVLDHEGNIQWVEAPFQAYCMVSTGNIKANSVVCIEGLAFTEGDELMYQIGQDIHPYYYFTLDNSSFL